jgi:hypothetical protein
VHIADTLSIHTVLETHYKMRILLLFVHVHTSVVSTGSINVIVDAFRSAKYSRRTGGGALWSGADGPRPGAGRSATWRRG